MYGGDIVKNYYTQVMYKDLMNHMCILCQTNEQKNDHILNWFESKKIKWKEKSLKCGDYSFCINADADLGFPVDTFFTDELFIERKNSLSELASSLNNEAFHYELKRSQGIKHKYLLVEQLNGLQGILSHDYVTQYGEKSFWTTLHVIEVRYGLKVKFVPKENMGLTIYSICKAVLDEYVLK